MRCAKGQEFERFFEVIESTSDKGVTVINHIGSCWLASSQTFKPSPPNFMWGWILTPSFCWKALVKKDTRTLLSLKVIWRNAAMPMGSWKTRSLRHHFNVHGYICWSQICFEQYYCRHWFVQRRHPIYANGRMWRHNHAVMCVDISLTLLWPFSDGEANLSECSYKLGFSYSPHYHLTLTVLALLSVHVCVPCTLAGKVREIFFIFTVIKACRK